MSRTVVKYAGWVASTVVLAVGPATYAAGIGSHEGIPQRPFSPPNKANCLVVAADQPPAGPRVVGGRQVLQKSFGEGDVVFVEGSGTAAWSPGQELQLVRGYGVLHTPDTGQVIGEVIGWMGFAEVIDADPERALVRITMSCSEIELGEYLQAPQLREVAEIVEIPAFDSSQLISPDPDDASVILGGLESVVSERGESRENVFMRETYAQGDVLIIDQGGAAGWSVGDIATFYRDRPSLQVRGARPPLVLALGLVVATGNDVASVMVVEGDLPVHLGDRARRTGSATTES